MKLKLNITPLELQNRTVHDEDIIDQIKVRGRTTTKVRCRGGDEDDTRRPAVAGGPTNSSRNHWFAKLTRNRGSGSAGFRGELGRNLLGVWLEDCRGSKKEVGGGSRRLAAAGGGRSNHRAIARKNGPKTGGLRLGVLGVNPKLQTARDEFVDGRGPKTSDGDGSRRLVAAGAAAQPPVAKPVQKQGMLVGGGFGRRSWHRRLGVARRW